MQRRVTRSDVTAPAELRQIRDQLPEAEDDEDWGELFELVDAGGWDATRGT